MPGLRARTPGSLATDLVAGDTGPAGARNFQLHRFHGNGSPDLGFGALGVASPLISAHDNRAEDMIVLSSGAILVGGNEVVDPNTMRPALARYTCDGALDTGFGVGGVLGLDLGEYGILHAVEHYSKDLVVVAGADVGMSPGPGTYGVVARLWM